MKLITTLFFYILMAITPKTDNMIELLKTHIQNKDIEKATLLIKQNPEVLSEEDENGSSGLMTIAYSGHKGIFEQAIKLKSSFSFHEAIVCGKIEVINHYFEKPNANLANTHSRDGFTPLSLAAFFNQMEIAKLLLENGADPNLSATNPSKVNALHSAVAKENYDLCKILLEKGADPDAVQMQNVTALHSAAHRGNLQLVELLIQNGASIELKMDNGDTALSIAKRDGHTACALALSRE